MRRVKRGLVLTGGAVLIASLVFLIWVRRSGIAEIDRCLDEGGAWDAQRLRCTFNDRDAVFEGFDLSDFWEDSDADSEHLVDAPFTDALVREVEEEFGVRLPESYLALMRVQNGGTPKRNSIPTDRPTGWAQDHVKIRQLMGIGRRNFNSILHERGSRFKQEAWGYPDVGIFIGMTPSGGHEAIMLDYRVSGPLGEPAVVYFDGDKDPDDPRSFVVLAPDFETFVRNLVDQSVYDTSAEDLKLALQEIRESRFGPEFEEVLAASASPKRTEQSIRKLLHTIATEKGSFALHADPNSHLFYDVLFMLYSDVHAVKHAEVFLEAYRVLFALADGLNTKGYGPDFIEQWMNTRLTTGDIVDSGGRLKVSDAHRQAVTQALAAYE